MKKSLKIFLIIVVSMLVLLMGVMHVLMGSSNHSETIEKLVALNIEVKPELIDFDNHKINTVIVGDINREKVLFIHGSPGSWNDWINMYKNDSLLSRYCLIGFDRPGLGETTLPANGNLKTQAAVAAIVMDRFRIGEEKYIIVGHSYGGAVLEQLLLDYPHLIKQGIFAGPTLSPRFQEVKWFNKIANFKAVNLILPQMLKSSNIEMSRLQKYLLLNERKLNSIETPITYIQGKKDVLVPFATVDYFNKHKSDGVKYVLIDEMNHFIPWSHPELIVEAIYD